MLSTDITTWILVAGAAEAKIYVKEKHSCELTLQADLAHPEGRALVHDLVTDHPGHYAAGSASGSYTQAHNPKDLFSSDPNGEYYFSGGWSLKAFYAIFIAFIISAATIWNENFRFLQSYSWLIGAFIGFMMHYLLSKK